MKRILTASVLLILVIGTGAFAREPRWNALGGDHRFIIDDTNYSVYPGSVTMFGNELFVIPNPNFLNNDFAGGALLNMKKSVTLGFHYNLASAGVSNLRDALAGLASADELGDAERDLRRADVGTPDWLKAREAVAIFTQKERLAAFDVRSFPDLILGVKMGSLGLGIRLAAAMDSVSNAAGTFEEAIMDSRGEVAVGLNTRVAEEVTTSATALDVGLGASVYGTPAGDLDLGLSLGIQSFSSDDPNHDLEIKSTGGMDLAVNARLNAKLSDGSALVPLVGLNMGSLPSVEYDQIAAPDVTEVSYMKGELGIGYRRTVKENGLVVAGILGGYDSAIYNPTITVELPAEEGAEAILEKKEMPETTDSSLSATVLAGSELPITGWLIARGGVRVRFSMISDEVAMQEMEESYLAGEESIIKDVVGTMKSTSVDYSYDMGLRTIHGGLIVDVLLTRNIIHRGLYFLTGASGNWATQVCATYRF